MKRQRATCPVLAGLCLLTLWAGPGSLRAQEQDEEHVQAIKEVVGIQEALALTYPEGLTLGIKFLGTERLPKASGEAKVERKKGFTEVEIELDEMKPASFFGGDYRTYVLWTVSPEGHAKNAGEFVLQGNRSKLDISTPLETFGMFITAEPHFLVEQPSRFVVLENSRPTTHIGPLKVARIKYRGFDGVYNYERETLAQMPEVKGEVRTELAQAYSAVELAERAAADEYAPEEMGRARAALRRAGDAAEAHAGEAVIRNWARDAVRVAVEAQKLAEERAFQAALDAERSAHARQIDQLSQNIARAQSEAERERLRAERRELELQMEERARRDAQQQAEEAARRAAEEARLRRLAEQRAEEATEQARELARREAQAAEEAERARREREEARARLEAALGYVAETRQTARGLIVNLPDILFDFDKASLRQEAREVVSRIAGILLVTPGIRLSIEGHTDSVGTEEYNQKLSEKRAQSVYEYLAGAGVSRDIMTMQGFGELQPVVPNDSSANRQKNRRVEIVITQAEDFALH